MNLHTSKAHICQINTSTHESMVGYVNRKCFVSTCNPALQAVTYNLVLKAVTYNPALKAVGGD